MSSFLIAIAIAIVGATPDPAADASAAGAARHEECVAILERAEAAMAAMDYDSVLPDARAAQQCFAPAVSDQVRAFILEGTALVVIGDTVGAEAPFRRALRLQHTLDLPASTPPKILAVFRKVQREELDAFNEDRRQRGARIQLVGAHPGSARGGSSILLAYELIDPEKLAKRVVAYYRKTGEAAFSSVALTDDGSGRWRGAIPGEWTANETGTQLELYVVVMDDRGGLTSVGSAEVPLVSPIAPGTAALPAGWAAAAAATTALGGYGLGILMDILSGFVNPANAAWFHPGENAFIAASLTVPLPAAMIVPGAIMWLLTDPWTAFVVAATNGGIILLGHGALLASGLAGLQPGDALSEGPVLMAIGVTAAVASGAAAALAVSYE